MMNASDTTVSAAQTPQKTPIEIAAELLGLSPWHVAELAALGTNGDDAIKLLLSAALDWVHPGNLGSFSEFRVWLGTQKRLCRIRLRPQRAIIDGAALAAGTVLGIDPEFVATWRVLPHVDDYAEAVLRFAVNRAVDFAAWDLMTGDSLTKRRNNNERPTTT